MRRTIGVTTAEHVVVGVVENCKLVACRSACIRNMSSPMSC